LHGGKTQERCRHFRMRMALARRVRMRVMMFVIVGMWDHA
jgi:hypothetical protein